MTTRTSIIDRPRPTRPGWRRWHLVGLTALTAWSTGIGWQAQAVSYPLYRAVPAADFLAYHAAYNAAIPTVVIVPGFASFLACAAFPWTRPPDVPRGLAAVVAAGGLGALVSTLAWAIPRHDRLDRIGRDAATIDSLLQANLVRSLVLSAATVALVVATAHSSRSPTSGAIR
ncbi:hypothetical protein [Actinomycetospora cinnamomea]|uniref:DUF1772 domain-containing protein n=1 Tax=Actinomycetospora cinnamomea TaxID=663609 RepID=A0A2U1EU18_9PSEU|nr:hypothetical protein [Actinomycetospora cinnamomea]PVZ03428.1 hypothetical protein C8D89_12128 [Actinomycetospora cinnamomea]